MRTDVYLNSFTRLVHVQVESIGRICLEASIDLRTTLAELTLLGLAAPSALSVQAAVDTWRPVAHKLTLTAVVDGDVDGAMHHLSGGESVEDAVVALLRHWPRTAALRNLLVLVDERPEIRRRVLTAFVDLLAAAYVYAAAYGKGGAHDELCSE